jgi:hypothetical protein
MALKYGAHGGNRTRCLFLTKEAFNLSNYVGSCSSVVSCSGTRGEIRTPDLQLRRLLLWFH